MSDDDNDKQGKRSPKPRLNNEVLTWVVGAGAVTSALFQLLGAQAAWLLLLGGFLILIVSTRQAWLDPQRWQLLKQWVATGNLRVGWTLLGGFLVLIGLTARFGPRDIGLVLSIVGLVLLIGGTWFLSGIHNSAIITPPRRYTPTIDRDEEKGSDSDGYTNISLEFRSRVAETVFRNAQTTSLMNFILGLTFFIVGIGLFVLLAYGVFQLQSIRTSTAQDDPLTSYIVQQLQSQLSQTSGQSLDEVLTQMAPILILILRDISARQLIPIVSLIIIALIGSRLIVNATRLSHRRVIREALEELGPLQDALAGIPPRKPALQVVEQSLRHTRRAFTIRLWLSVILGGVGILLLFAAFIRSLQPDNNDWITTATVGASGVISFIVSLVTTRQKEIGENLTQVNRVETHVALNAQRSEIIDLYVAQLVRSGAKPQQLKEVLTLLENLQETERSLVDPSSSDITTAEKIEKESKQSKATGRESVTKH